MRELWAARHLHLRILSCISVLSPRYPESQENLVIVESRDPGLRDSEVVGAGGSRLDLTLVGQLGTPKRPVISRFRSCEGEANQKTVYCDRMNVCPSGVGKCHGGIGDLRQIPECAWTISAISGDLSWRTFLTVTYYESERFPQYTLVIPETLNGPVSIVCLLMNLRPGAEYACVSKIIQRRTAEES